MGFNEAKGFKIPDGLNFEDGAYVTSGASSPQGLFNPSTAALYIQNNGDVWYHTGSGGINAWRKTALGDIPSLSQVPVFNGNGTLASVTYYSSATQITANRIAKVDLTYDGNLNPTTEVETYYSTADGTSVLKTVTRTYTFTNQVLTNVTQVTT